MSKYKKQDESDKKSCIIVLLLLALLISSSIAVLGMMSAVDSDTDEDDDDDQWSTTSPTTTTTPPTTTTTPDGGDTGVQHYRLTWTFQWDALLDPSAKCAITITIRDPTYPASIWDTLTLPEETGDEPFTYHPMSILLPEGQRVVIGISNTEGYEFIINSLTVSTHYNSASATGISYAIGYDGMAAPIQVGTYFSEWEMM